MHRHSLIETKTGIDMAFPIIAATLGAFLIILQQVLMLSVGMHRGQTGIGVGYADDRHLERKARRHGNLAENAAIFIVVLAIAELYGGPRSVIIGFAIAFAVARFSHLIGFMSLNGSHEPTETKLFLPFRMVGALGSVAAGAGLGLYLIYLLYAA